MSEIVSKYQLGPRIPAVKPIVLSPLAVQFELPLQCTLVLWFLLYLWISLRVFSTRPLPKHKKIS